MMFFKKKLSKENDIKKIHLIQELERLCSLNEIFQEENFKEKMYLDERGELEKSINKLLRLKNQQVRKQFLTNNNILEYITQMNYVKNMIDNIVNQKKYVEDIVSSGEQMSVATEKIAGYIQSSALKTNDAIKVSKNSLNVINNSFDYINKSFNEIILAKDKMEKVVQDTNEVDNITTMINEIAEQTNLLALNASIEAARAGEQGKGFAVVAQEIKKLSDSTKTSVGFIREKIKSLREEVYTSEKVLNEAVAVFSEGKKQINSSATSMDQMKTNLNEIGFIFENISASVEEQNALTQEMSAKINQLDAKTEDLKEHCIKTGQGIYDVSAMLEEARYLALPWYKDIHSKDSLGLNIVEHLIFRWKAYNVICGFVSLNEESIMKHNECNLGKHFESKKQNNPNDSDVLETYETHKKIHSLTRDLISEYNKGNKEKAELYLTELDDTTNSFLNMFNYKK